MAINAFDTGCTGFMGSFMVGIWCMRQLSKCVGCGHSSSERTVGQYALFPIALDRAGSFFGFLLPRLLLGCRPPCSRGAGRQWNGTHRGIRTSASSPATRVPARTDLEAHPDGWPDRPVVVSQKARSLHGLTQPDLDEHATERNNGRVIT